MILAQAEPVVHEVIIQSSTPWHIYIAAVIGALIAIGGWIVVHRTSQSRDLKNWRRTTLVQSTMELLAASNERFEAVNDSASDRSVAKAAMRRIEIQFQTIRLLGDDELMEAAQEIWQKHTISSAAFNRYFAGRGQDFQVLDAAQMDEWELEGYHHNLTQALKNSLQQKKRKGSGIKLNSPTGSSDNQGS
ncbi:hypothetical protein KHP11_13580 [Rhodococcus erythropolis]|uniref:hypothetical protein n=1 Tax=Rhodococcus erythropolis TaxID=1833 RepID=UPI0008A1CC5C|nr:hypothetical protein [Rhodococcus erythropolis]MBT1255491.1 hypothetical protein [Rhodococcus erythropolis]OHF26012.1 hypothetical protein BKP30_20650 [Rhodococcus erythropolis]